MGQVFESQKKENLAKALIASDIDYINNHWEEISIRSWRNLYVDSPYYTHQDPHSEMPTFDSPVNILERVVYEAKHDNEEIWNTIFYLGADVNLIANFAQEPITHTTEENTWYKKSVLEAAILKNKPNLVKTLIKYDANINYKNPKNKNKTPITLAFSKKRSDIIKIIINKKGVNYINNDGLSFLHLAVIHENINIVKFLLENNANLNIKDNWDDTPLFDAQYLNNVEIFKLLVKKGADLTKKDKKGQTIKQVLELEKKRLVMEYQKFCPDKYTFELSFKFKFSQWKIIYEKTDNDSVKKIISKIMSKDEMLNIIKNYNDFDSDDINSRNYQNEPSTSGYKPISPKI